MSIQNIFDYYNRHISNVKGNSQASQATRKYYQDCIRILTDKIQSYGDSFVTCCEIFGSTDVSSAEYDYNNYYKGQYDSFDDFVHEFYKGLNFSENQEAILNECFDFDKLSDYLQSRYTYRNGFVFVNPYA